MLSAGSIPLRAVTRISVSRIKQLTPGLMRVTQVSVLVAATKAKGTPYTVVREGLVPLFSTVPAIE